MDKGGRGGGWPGEARWAQGQGQVELCLGCHGRAVPREGPHPTITKPLWGHISVPVGAARMHLLHPWRHPGNSAWFIYNFLLASPSLLCANCLETLENPDCA